MSYPLLIECPLCLGQGKLKRTEVLDRLEVKDFARVAQLSAEEAYRLLQQKHTHDEQSAWSRYETELAKRTAEIRERHKDEVRIAQRFRHDSILRLGYLSDTSSTRWLELFRKIGRYLSPCKVLLSGSSFSSRLALPPFASYRQCCTFTSAIYANNPPGPKLQDSEGNVGATGTGKIQGSNSWPWLGCRKIAITRSLTRLSVLIRP